MNDLEKQARVAADEAMRRYTINNIRQALQWAFAKGGEYALTKLGKRSP